MSMVMGEGLAKRLVVGPWSRPCDMKGFEGLWLVARLALCISG